LARTPRRRGRGGIVRRRRPPSLMRPFEAPGDAGRRSAALRGMDSTVWRRILRPMPDAGTWAGRGVLGRSCLRRTPRRGGRARPPRTLVVAETPVTDARRPPSARTGAQRRPRRRY